MSVRILQGDCRSVMAEMPEASIDAIVTDPPYELGFMGKGWDATGVANDPATWRAALRVLKPGGHLLAFSGTRTYHRMVCAIEDAGFEIRDQIGWLYGSGFPKSLDVSKAIDKAAGAERDVVGSKLGLPGYHLNGHDGGEAFGAGLSSSTAETRLASSQITAPATDAARQWQGWGTALKPSQEPLVVARRPYENSTEWVTIERAIVWLWEGLWFLVPASDAAPDSASSLPGSNAVGSGSARWGAEQLCSTGAALSARMGTSQFATALASCLNTVRSWSDTLAAASQHASTSTTSTETRATTDLRTLGFSLSRITPENIILAHRSGQWSSADACNAARCSSAIVATLSATLERSAAESAIAQERDASLDVGASPNLRPIVVARKPLIGTVAANVLQFGTGGLNIDGCRVDGGARPLRVGENDERKFSGDFKQGSRAEGDTTLGRWPANIIQDGSDEVMAAFPDTRGGWLSGSSQRGLGYHGAVSEADGTRPATKLDDGGSAARFFYTAKASAYDRNDGLQKVSGSERSHHPTVKPTDLMRYLCRLVTPPGGTVLDPFMGSGSTLKAAELEGFSAIGIELDPAYIEIAKRRIASDAPLFAEVA